MSRPPSFTWIEKPLLGALAFPDSPEELDWLRGEGIQVARGIQFEQSLQGCRMGRVVCEELLHQKVITQAARCGVVCALAVQ